ncbi:MAG: hypothetical protein O9296_10230 [Novosphingobium sp.]|jgi:hypothetical protein|nr:hypothetical protein [Novosphingobium sp.]
MYKRAWRKIHPELGHIGKRYWDKRFWQQGYFSALTSNVSSYIIMRYSNDLPTKTNSTPRHVCQRQPVIHSAIYFVGNAIPIDGSL